MRKINFIAMKIYEVKTKEKLVHEDYEAMIVVADSGEEAMEIAETEHSYFKNLTFSDLGIAHEGAKKGIILISFYRC